MNKKLEAERTHVGSLALPETTRRTVAVSPSQARSLAAVLGVARARPGTATSTTSRPNAPVFRRAFSYLLSLSQDILRRPHSMKPPAEVTLPYSNTCAGACTGSKEGGRMSDRQARRGWCQVWW